MFSILPTTPTFMNTYFVFEVTAFVIGVLLLYLNNKRLRPKRHLLKTEYIQNNLKQIKNRQILLLLSF